jgi:hypothetical protein
MSSLAISSGGRALEQRSCLTTASSFVDAIHDPQILTSHRAATENATKQCSSFNRALPLLRSSQMRAVTNLWLTPAAINAAAAQQLIVMTRSSDSLRRDH